MGFDQDLETLDFDQIWKLGVDQDLETLEFDQIWKPGVVQDLETWSLIKIWKLGFLLEPIVLSLFFFFVFSCLFNLWLFKKHNFRSNYSSIEDQSPIRSRKG